MKSLKDAAFSSAFSCSTKSSTVMTVHHPQMAEMTEHNLTFDDEGWSMCPVQGCKYSSHGLRFRGWSNEASARRHFTRHHEGKLHVGRAILPKVTREQRRDQMRKASQAYRDRELIKRRRANVAREAKRRFPDKAGFVDEGRRAPIHLLPAACRASMLVHAHRVGLLDVASLSTYHALNELGRQMRQFRKSLLLRLHPDKAGWCRRGRAPGRRGGLQGDLTEAESGHLLVPDGRAAGRT